MVMPDFNYKEYIPFSSIMVDVKDKRKVDDVLKNLEEYNKTEEEKRLKLEQQTFENTVLIIFFRLHFHEKWRKLINEND